MSKLGFTFYMKDWWTSDMFFDLKPLERYFYLEMIFIMYNNGGYFNYSKEQFEKRLITQIKPNIWQKITQHLTQTDLGYTHESVKKRRSKAETSRENGKKGGRPKKPKNPEINLKNPLIERENKYKDKRNPMIKQLKDHYKTNSKWFYKEFSTLQKSKGHLSKLLKEFEAHIMQQTDIENETLNDWIKHFKSWVRKKVQHEYGQ